MNLAYLDFETYWSTEHSLSKMSPYEYVMHPDTEIISCSLRVNDMETQVAFGEDNVRDMLACVDWANTLGVAHNMHGFDGLVLKWRFGMEPAVWGCTLAMARAKYQKVTRLGLGPLCEYLNIGVKDSTVLVQTKGKHLADFTGDEIRAMGTYNRSDTDNGVTLFKHCRKFTSAREMLLIDMTIRMAVDPEFIIDYDLLNKTLGEEQQRKRQVLLDMTSDEDKLFHNEDELIELVRAQLASAAKFGAFLKRWGVDVPMKKSPTNPLTQIPALAKTDEGFLALMDHPDPMIQMAARARMDVKSTLLETRIKAFMEAADACEGKLPIPLRYYGAHTGRWSGEQYNPQNMPRINKDKPKPADALRLSLTAPPGYAVMAADQSGIELRVNHTLWKVPSSVSLYRQDPKADLYRAFAAIRYNCHPDAVTKDQRQLAKVAQLGLGFGAGAETFMRVAKIMGGLDLSLAESRAIVDNWREMYVEIVRGWTACNNALDRIAGGRETYLDPGELVRTTPEGLLLPTGRLIYYPHLTKKADGYVYGLKQNQTKIYGGKVDENVVQALARDVLADCALQFWKQYGYRPKLMVHDELVYIVPEDDAEDLLAALQEIMRTPPAWWQDLVVWSEGSVAHRYGDAK